MPVLKKRFQKPAGWKWDEFTNERGFHIRTGSLIVSKDPVCDHYLGPSMGQPGEMLYETARNLADMGHNVHLISWAGQGGSGQYLRDRFHRTTGGYDADADDLLRLARRHVKGNAPKVLTGSSMGGMISLLAVIKNAKMFQALNLADPFLGFANPKAPYLKKALELIPYLPEWILQHYAPGEGKWKARSNPARKLRAEDYSSDPLRMRIYDEWTMNNPQLRVGGVTLGCFRESCRIHDRLQTDGAPESISIPVQLFSCGINKVTSPRAIFDLAARLPNSSHMHFADAKHDLLMEDDIFRTPLIHNLGNSLSR